MEGITLTVSQLNDYVRRLLASDPIVQHITLRGEISNFKPYASGHWYFTLKDDTGRIDCALFRQYTYGVPFMPQDGMRVLVKGSAGLYVQGGKFQFYADGMTQDGVGDLYRRYLELKERLTAEGLFDASRKRPLPLLPRAVGIVTSESGAVQHDIRTVAGRRFPGLPLVLRPAQVQGDGAAQDIVRGIEQLSRRRDIDVIIVGRGGGSLEDLWAFNEEIVVRAVAACPVPVISAVGHETDTTLCDFAADMRAPTPSAAAELAVPELAALRDTVGDLLHAVDQAAAHTLLEKDRALARLEHRLSAREPLSYVREMTLRTQHLKERLAAALDKRLTLLSGRLSQAQEHLRAVGPQAVLGRGYTIALRKGQAVASASQAGGDMTLIFRDGRANVRVQSVWEGDPFANEEGKANL